MGLTDDQKEHIRHVSLDLWERKMLEFVAEHAGEVTFDYKLVDPKIKKKMTDLCAKGVLGEVPHEFRGKDVVWLRLTDQGRALVSYLKTLYVGKT